MYPFARSISAVMVNFELKLIITWSSLFLFDKVLAWLLNYVDFLIHTARRILWIPEVFFFNLRVLCVAYGNFFIILLFLRIRGLSTKFANVCLYHTEWLFYNLCFLIQSEVVSSILFITFSLALSDSSFFGSLYLRILVMIFWGLLFFTILAPFAIIGP